MIKLVIFDMDGVLIDARELHYKALNEALPPMYRIDREDHLANYDGLPTTRKLAKLCVQKGMSEKIVDSVWEKKQGRTLALISDTVVYDEKKRDMLEKLREDGVVLACASNSIRATVDAMLKQAELDKEIRYVYGNDDVVHPKPNAEMYLRCMVAAGVGPAQTVIVEDSIVGRKAAREVTNNVLCVSGPDDVTYDLVRSYIDRISEPKSSKWKDGKLNIVIPMEGKGKRFTEAGYTFPKPLIDVNGKPMIQVVYENLNIDAHFIFIVKQEDIYVYNFGAMLKMMCPNCTVVPVDGVSEGATCSVLKARDLIDNDEQLLLANCDQVYNWDSSQFMWAMNRPIDGGILTFETVHPKWSFAKVQDGFVTEVAEKKPISNRGTVGVYYWKRGSDFVKYADQMISKDKRVNNEFYVCPVYNEAIEDGQKVVEYPVEGMQGLGTPEDLEAYLRSMN